MRHRTFGRMGWKVSEIGFGAWAIGGSWGPQNERDSLAALNRALDLGCNFIDTAPGYGDGKSERLLAQVLKRHAMKPLVVATKIPPKNRRWPAKQTARGAVVLFHRGHEHSERMAHIGAAEEVLW